MSELHHQLMYEVEELDVGDGTEVRRIGYVRLLDGELWRWLAGPIPKWALRIRGVRLNEDLQPRAGVVVFAGDRLWPAHLAVTVNSAIRPDERLRYWRWLGGLSEEATKLYVERLANDAETQRRAEAMESFARYDLCAAESAMQAALFSRMPALASDVTLESAAEPEASWPGSRWPAEPAELDAPIDGSAAALASPKERLWLEMVSGWRQEEDSVEETVGRWHDAAMETARRWSLPLGHSWWRTCDTPRPHPDATAGMQQSPSAMTPPTWQITAPGLWRSPAQEFDLHIGRWDTEPTIPWVPRRRE